MIADVSDPDRALVLTYARADRRAALAALFRLDEALGQVLRGGREPMLAQLRLTWWHEALCRLDHAPAPAEPVLAGLAAAGFARGAELAGLVEGWEMLIEPEIDDAGLDLYARRRGAGLFALAARALGADHAAVARAGEGWALADLARHCSDPALAARALARAGDVLEPSVRWPTRLRALGALAALAARDVRRGADAIEPAGTPGRMLCALRHRLTGG